MGPCVVKILSRALKTTKMAETGLSTAGTGSRKGTFSEVCCLCSLLLRFLNYKEDKEFSCRVTPSCRAPIPCGSGRQISIMRGNNHISLLLLALIILACCRAAAGITATATSCPKPVNHAQYKYKNMMDATAAVHCQVGESKSSEPQW